MSHLFSFVSVSDVFQIVFNFYFILNNVLCIIIFYLFTLNHL